MPLVIGERRTGPGLLQTLQRKAVEPKLIKMHQRVSVDMNKVREAMRLLHIKPGARIRHKKLEFWNLLKDSTIQLPSINGRITVVKEGEHGDDSGHSSTTDSDTETIDEERVYVPAGGEIINLKTIRRMLKKTEGIIQDAEVVNHFTLFQEAELFRDFIVLPPEAS